MNGAEIQERVEALVEAQTETDLRARLEVEADSAICSTAVRMLKTRGEQIKAEIVREHASRLARRERQEQKL